MDRRSGVRRWGICVTLLLALSFAGAAPTAEEAASAVREAPPKAAVSGPLGTNTNPVRCEMPAGERAYLQRLRGPDGQPPRSRRVGSFAPGPYGNILDGYEVTSGGKTVMIFMDMYHPGHVEREAVPGFTIADPPTAPPE